MCTLIEMYFIIMYFKSLQMFDWIYHNRDVFLSNYVDIGHSFSIAKKLQEDHNHFTLGSNVSKMKIGRFRLTNDIKKLYTDIESKILFLNIISMI